MDNRSASGEEARRSLADLENRYVLALQPMIEAATRWTHQLSELWLPILQESAGQQKAWLNLHNEVYPMLVARGWLLSPSAPALLMDRIMLKAQGRDGEAIDGIMMDIFQPDTCRETLERCYGRSSFAKWRGTFAKAIAAHANGDPELAIPIWLLAIDGICQSELDLTNIFSKISKIPQRRKVESRLGYDPAHDLLRITETSGVLDVLAHLGRRRSARSHNDPPQVVPRRHDILHGAIPSIGDASDSVRCILVLENLNWIFDCRDRAFGQ